jgi:uncharacterized protein
MAATHRFSVLLDVYAVVRLGPHDAIPEWALGATEFVSITRTADELSIVCPEAVVASSECVERGWRVIKLHGPYPFDQVGVLSSFASPLAQHAVSIFALSTFDTDYLLVKASHLERAVAVLQASGHLHVRGEP